MFLTNKFVRVWGLFSFGISCILLWLINLTNDQIKRSTMSKRTFLGYIVARFNSGRRADDMRSALRDGIYGAAPVSSLTALPVEFVREMAIQVASQLHGVAVMYSQGDITEEVFDLVLRNSPTRQRAYSDLVRMGAVNAAISYMRQSSSSKTGMTFVFEGPSRMSEEAVDRLMQRAPDATDFMSRVADRVVQLLRRDFDRYQEGGGSMPPPGGPGGAPAYLQIPEIMMDEAPALP